MTSVLTGRMTTASGSSSRPLTPSQGNCKTLDSSRGLVGENTQLTKVKRIKAGSQVLVAKKFTVTWASTELLFKSSSLNNCIALFFSFPSNYERSMRV